MPRLFISYSRVDGDFAERLVSRLRRNPRYEVWYDDSLHGGDHWWNEILDQIAGCDIFIYLLSNDSVTSSYCQAEFTEARRLRKMIITVQVRDRTQISGELGDIQYIDMKAGANDGDALMRLTASIDYQAEQLPKRRPKPLSEELTQRPNAPTEDDKNPSRPDVDTPTLTSPHPIETSTGDRRVARATVIAAIITGSLAIVAVIVGVVLPMILNNGSREEITTTPTQSVTAFLLANMPTETVTLIPSPIHSPVPSATPQPTLASSDTPQPSATKLPTLSLTEVELTVTAEYGEIMREIQQTQDSAATIMADSLTTTAGSWTDTPTPDSRQTAIARITLDAAAIATQEQNYLNATNSALGTQYVVDTATQLAVNASFTESAISATSRVFALTSTTLFTPTSTPTPITFQARAKGYVHLRSAPSPDAPIVLLLAPDTSVTVSAQAVGQAYSNSQNNIWYRVTTRQGDSDVSGYVISAAIELIASEENQGAPPLITLTPTPRSG